MDLYDLGTGAKSVQDAIGEMQLYQPGSSKPDKNKIAWHNLVDTMTVYRTLVEKNLPVPGRITFKDGHVRIGTFIPIG